MSGWRDRIRRACALALCWGALTACASEAPGGDGRNAYAARALVVLPDTQFYACHYADIFRIQTGFIAEHAEQLGIGAVLHTGDIVDSDVPPQWQIASESMHRLDGQVPYLVVSGNHDLEAGRHTLMGDYFDANMLSAWDDTSGAYSAPQVENSYAIATIAGRRWLFLGLEFGPRDAVVAWADSVLSQYAELPTIVFTHAYLYSDGQRYDRKLSPAQPYHPDQYHLTPEQGINDGEDLFRKLIEPHENVRLVLSGHVIPLGQARSVATRASGSSVHQVLANYQLCDACPCPQVEGGGGYMRILSFEPDSWIVHVTTYSPHYDNWLRDDANQFDLTL